MNWKHIFTTDRSDHNLDPTKILGEGDGMPKLQPKYEFKGQEFEPDDIWITTPWRGTRYVIVILKVIGFLLIPISLYYFFT